jgi:Fe-coproporphyrin III synthase
MQLSLSNSVRRYRSLQTHRITSLPIAILMPHSSCNCRCVMCDIWKGNANRKQLTIEDISSLLDSFKQLHTRQVVMSGGEALLNENFFTLCKLLRENHISVTLLSTGLLLKKNAADILKYVKEVIVSLDGDESTHDAIRSIDGAFRKLKEGVQYLRQLDPSFRITGRSVIQRLNFRNWPLIIDAAKEIGLDSISFLPADISSQAFNRENPWEKDHVMNVAIQPGELNDLQFIIDNLIENYAEDFNNRFISEPQSKIQKIHQYYSAVHGLNDFPIKKCNAPWVSAVVEADGAIKPCFFHNTTGNIRTDSLKNILNSDNSIDFRCKLNIDEDPICKRCVCSLNLPFYKDPA